VNEASGFRFFVVIFFFLRCILLFILPGFFFSCFPLSCGAISIGKRRKYLVGSADLAIVAYGTVNKKQALRTTLFVGEVGRKR